MGKHPQVDLRPSCTWKDAQAAPLHAWEACARMVSALLQEKTTGQRAQQYSQAHQHQEVAGVAEVQEVVVRPVTQSISTLREDMRMNTSQRK